jgi:folate-binding protein YgfZ
MNSSWHAFLQERGARIESGVVHDFGDAAGERKAARTGSVLADLSHLAVLEFSGADADAFLQGQLSCDVTAISQGQATLGAYCTPKGRMLADFFLARDKDGLLMVLPRALAEPVKKRLHMFVLRSKVEITDAGERRVLLGAAGPAAREEIAALPGGQLVLEVPRERVMILASPESAVQDWASLSAKLKEVGTPCWEWLDIRNGIPLIGPATQDQLVPQMANLELIGGVSFSKGCYPGQEIVARSQYLGKVKRRMYLARLEAEARPQPGDKLFSDDLGNQASGIVVNAQPSPEGGYDLLAVAQVSSKEGSTVRLRSPDGPALKFQPLPYEVH